MRAREEMEVQHEEERRNDEVQQRTEGWKEGNREPNKKGE